MSDPTARTFSSDFRRFFVRGLVVLLPSVLTLWIVVKAYQFIDNTIAEPINHGVRLSMMNMAPYWEPLRTQFDPDAEELSSALVAAGPKAPTTEIMRAKLRAEHINAWWAEHWYLNLIGLVIAIIAVYVAGRLLGGFLGRRFYRKIERIITSLPVFKQVYPHVKQIVDFLFSDERSLKFSRVVMVPYPRKGVWSLGFQTGAAVRGVEPHAAEECVTVFIPSSPTPFTGYAVTVPRRDVIEVQVSVEEAVRFIVSGGVLVPTDVKDSGGSPELVPIPVPEGLLDAPPSPPKAIVQGRGGR